MPSYRSSNLGKFLRPFREQRGISTVKEFGEMTGIRRSHLSEIENGRRNLTEKMASRIAEAVGMTEYDLRQRLLQLSADDRPTTVQDRGEQSWRVSEEPRTYGRMISYAPDSNGLLRHLVSKMSREEQFALLRELTDAGEAGDLTAVPKARALLALMPQEEEEGRDS